MLDPGELYIGWILKRLPGMIYFGFHQEFGAA